LAGVSLVDLVLSLTVTAVGEASVPVTLMVLPDTEATEPVTDDLRPGGGVDGPDDGVGVLEGGVELGAGSLPSGHLPLTAGLMRTDAAVIG
jgi:hypothetical protein